MNNDTGKENETAERIAGSDTDDSSRPDEKSSTSAFRDLGRSAKKAACAGARDARKFAEGALPDLKDLLVKGIRDLTWGAAWLTGFSIGAIREITPKSIAEGAKDGAASGRAAAEKVFRERPEASEGHAGSPEAG